jgi:hypothetical protein
MFPAHERGEPGSLALSQDDGAFYCPGDFPALPDSVW